MRSFWESDILEEHDIPGWLPEGQITLLAADGGIGKTTLWCHIIAALSSGSRCVLNPPDYTRPPAEVSFLTTEDSVKKKLARKLRLAGANMNNVYAPDFSSDKDSLLRALKFGSPEMERFVRDTMHKLYVFDPVQGFIPPSLNMGSRNAMRDCLAPLISLGEETGATFLIIAHTNKRKGASGRDRVADSADLWDISRSVLMAGYTDEQGVRYLSNEKKTKAGRRDVPLSEELETCLLEQRKTAKSDYIFTMQNGKPLTKNAFRKLFDHISRELPEKHITAHSLRHTYITRLFEAGLDIKEIQYLAGHATVDMTLSVYTHYDRLSREAETSKKVRKALSGPEKRQKSTCEKSGAESAENSGKIIMFPHLSAG